MSNTKKLVYASLFLAAGILIPQIFHLTGGPTSGGTFLPMHIPVLIGGFLLGGLYGSLIGLLAPVLSFIITGMPPAERLPFMVVELVSYGFFCGFLSSKTKHIYPVLVSSMTIGRLLYAGSLFIAFYLFKMQTAAPIAAWFAFLNGLVGIIIQLIFIPPVVFSLRKITSKGRVYY